MLCVKTWDKKRRQTVRNEIERMVLTVPEVAEALSLSRNGAYAMAKAGQIPAVRIGKRIVVPRAQFDKLLAGEWTPKTSDRLVR